MMMVAIACSSASRRNYPHIGCTMHQAQQMMQQFYDCYNMAMTTTIKLLHQLTPAGVVWR
jgi:hypothetical protein